MTRTPDDKSKWTSGSRPMVELSFPSDSRYLHMVHELTQQLAVATGFEESEADKIAMAMDEAVTNVIQHAYHAASDRKIEITFDPEGESLEIVIIHDGEGLEDVPLPEFNLGKLVAERQTGGLGLTIMRQMMDDLRFEKTDSGKSMCVMVRYKQRKPGGE